MVFYLLYIVFYYLVSFSVHSSLVFLIFNYLIISSLAYLLTWFHFLSLQKRILDYTRYEMMNKALDAFGDLGDDEELGPSDWATVKRYITCLNNLEGDQVHPHAVPDKEDNFDAMNLKDIRIRLLNGKCDLIAILCLFYFLLLPYYFFCILRDQMYFMESFINITEKQNMYKKRKKAKTTTLWKAC